MIPPSELKLILTGEIPACNYCAKKLTHLKNMSSCIGCLANPRCNTYFKPIKNLNTIDSLIRSPENICYSCDLRFICNKKYHITEECITQMERKYEENFTERLDTPVDP